MSLVSKCKKNKVVKLLLAYVGITTLITLIAVLMEYRRNKPENAFGLLSLFGCTFGFMLLWPYIAYQYCESVWYRFYNWYKELTKNGAE